jgi:hypothetical protein
MANFYETGSTVTLRATFVDISGTPTNTEGLPTVTIYDENFRVVGSPITATFESTGNYKVDYIIPFGTANKVYFYEFKGSLTGILALNRDKFYARFSA